jgi:CRISPR-associated endonuclease/helicase Cas3
MMPQESEEQTLRGPLPGLPFFVAHTPPKGQTGPWHPLKDHLQRVADLSAEFASQAFAPSDLASTAVTISRYLGLRHDLGKVSDEFQGYLWACFDNPRHGRPAPRAGSAPHKEDGAIAAIHELGAMGKYLAAPLHGHHGQMLRPDEAIRKAREKSGVDRFRMLSARVSAVDASLVPAAPDFGPLFASRHCVDAGGKPDPRATEMAIRILYSCLTDADSLDTEAHCDRAAAGIRGNADTLTAKEQQARLVEMRNVLRTAQGTLLSGASATKVNGVRRKVYEACVTAGDECPPGVFSLTVPTGGGKTRSSLAFALEHAAAHGLRRVIYAIPYTSIVDQTTQVFREIFGDDVRAVLEHHSAIEPNEGEDTGAADMWRRLAAQNWSAPLVVTTTVQLFESLFGNRPGKCRKLHRLAGSIIVLDEVQTLPTELLQPLVDGLRVLAENFGASIVLCTATQPALDGNEAYLRGFGHITPIIAEPAPHFQALKRVTYQLEPEPRDWLAVASDLRAERDSGRSALCIVNTRRDALALLDILDPTSSQSEDYGDPDILHLSTLLCGRHRRAVLAQVRERLTHGPPVILVSTTVCECGVDIDMHAVYRAVGPLDRIIQAAGRCNREGLRPVEESVVHVFTPKEGRTPQGTYRTAIAETRDLFHVRATRGETVPFDDPDLSTQYFRQLYGTLGPKELDRYGVQEYRTRFDYPEVAHLVRLIREETVSVLVTDCPGAEEEAKAIIGEARGRGGMTRTLWQRASALSVSLYERDAPTGVAVEEIVPGLLVWTGKAYHAKRGIPLPDDPADLVVYRPDALIS